MTTPDSTLETLLLEKVMACPMSGCWLWCGQIDHGGYGQIWLPRRIQPKHSPRATHRFSWEIHKGKIPEGKFVCHVCDVRSCVNPAHLFLGTRRDNVDDMVKKGRNAKHERAAAAKLNWVRVKEIRESTKSNAELGRIFSVNEETVRLVRRGVTWKT